MRSGAIRKALCIKSNILLKEVIKMFLDWLVGGGLLVALILWWINLIPYI